MFLAVDIGNSDITIGVYSDESWKYIWRLPSGKLTEVYYGLQLQNYFLEVGMKTSMIDAVVISSVVPDLTETFVLVTSTLSGVKPIVVGLPVYDKIPVKVMNPYQIGTDLVANAVAAFDMFKKAVVVVDFGTALTFTVVTADARIDGVAIVPGLKTALRSLSQHTAKLFEVPLDFPSSVLGKNTVHAIQAGILYGYEGIVKNILDQVKTEVGPNISSVATGGLSAVIPTIKDMVDRIEPTLTLDGLRIIHSCVSGKLFKKV